MQVQIARKWECPREGWLKVNVDGSFIAETGEASVGAVIRDHTGRLIVAAGRPIVQCHDAEEVKALACLEGVRLAET